MAICDEKKEPSAYEKLQDFKADLARKAYILQIREGEILTELAERERNFPEAVIQGGSRTAQEKMDGLKVELENLRRELQAYINPPTGGWLKGLVTAAWEEAVNEITVNLRAEWNAEMEEMEKAKAAFLSSVSKLGQIKARGDSVTWRIQEAILSLPGPKLPPPSLATNIYVTKNPERRQGPIFLDPLLIEKTFTGGR